jgi:sugar phosphate isomerase/epimerase
MIRIGNQSAYSADTLMAPFLYAVKHRFDAFEWFPDKKMSGEGWDEDDLDKKTRRAIKETAADHNIRLSIHAPLHWNPIDEKTKDHFHKDIALAKDIDAALINIHLVGKKDHEKFLQAILPCVKNMAKSGIMLSIENTPLTSPEDFNTLFALVAQLEPALRDQIGMCLDLGHANLCAATQNDYIRFIDLLDSQVPIVHVHLHENYGDQDSHLPVFTGPASKDHTGISLFVEKMRNRHFSGMIILEQWPEPPGLLESARNKLLRLWHA